MNFLDKIVSLEKLAYNIQEFKKKGLKVGMCHGCFDILHIGHLRHLEAAKSLADVLVVTVTPDRFVNKK